MFVFFRHTCSMSFLSPDTTFGEFHCFGQNVPKVFLLRRLQVLWYKTRVKYFSVGLICNHTAQSEDTDAFPIRKFHVLSSQSHTPRSLSLARSPLSLSLSLSLSLCLSFSLPTPALRPSQSHIPTQTSP